MRRYWALIIASLIITSGFFFLPEIKIGKVGGATLYVGPGGNYSKIQDAIDNASAGDTIRIFNGTYYESIVIDKSLTIIGNGSVSTRIRGYGNTHAGWIRSSNVSMQNVSFSIGRKERPFSALMIDPGLNNVSLKNCNLSRSQYGVSSGATSSGTVSNVTLENCELFDNVYGLRIFNNYNMIIVNSSLIYNLEYGIYEHGSNQTKIYNSTFINNENGLTSDSSVRGSIMNNTIKNSEYGLTIISGSKIEMFGNNISENSYGLSIEKSDMIFCINSFCNLYEKCSF
ncbi:MAG: nitrous oxide reductase family maturation protein NosD, partial [Thermoplasmatota archaeon]